MNFTLAVVCLLVWPGCSGSKTDSPEATYREFRQALLENDWDRAVKFLPDETLETFRRVGARLSKAIGQKGDADPLHFFLRSSSAKVVPLLRSVEVVSRGDQTALLKVTACTKDKETVQCSDFEVKLRRAAKGWVLDPEMPELLSGGGA